MKKDKEKILNYLQEVKTPLKLRRIYKKFKKIEQQRIDFILNSLIDEGKIIKIDKNKYIITGAIDFRIGKLSLNKDGYGFVDPIEGGKGIFIPPRYIGFALDRDIVKCRIMKNKKRDYGIIEEILERGSHKIVGKVIVKNKKLCVRPVDTKIHFDFKLDFKDTLIAKEGNYVVLSIKHISSPKIMPSVKIIENLGNDNPKIDIEILLRKYNIIPDFNDNVLYELDSLNETITEKEINSRIDLRDLLCFTIDGEDAKDFDDAVAIQKLTQNRYRLFVHIADVSYYVRPDSELDKTAYEKATSVYFPDKVFPMLPEKLSNELCSLKPFEDRLTMTCEMVVTAKGDVQKFKIYNSIINSKARLTYNIVQKIIDGDKNVRMKYPYVVNSILEMNELADILERKRLSRGSINFDMPEPRLILDENGIPVDVGKWERLKSHKLIEEFMILANETVAKFISDKKAPSIYRVHEPPNMDKVENFLNIFKLIGIKIPKYKKITPKFFQDIINSVAGRPEENLINFLMLRTMSIARYSTDNIGHFGLASLYYTHFTSPIRRYADLVIHRILKLLIKNKSVKRLKKFSKDNLELICKHITEQSINAQNAERDIVELKQIQFISKEIGNIFEGIITKITEKEIKIELIDSLIWGSVLLKDIKDDYYIVDDSHYFIRGRRNKKTYRIGERVIVKLIDVVEQERIVKFKLVRKVKPIKYPKGN